MAYKGAHYQVPSAVHLVETIKDFLVACGWVLEGPTATLTDRQNQDDEHAHILGWFLHSDGEDGQQDINLHLHFAGSTTDASPGWTYSYLASSVSPGDGAFPLKAGSGSDWSTGDYFKVGSEIGQVGSVSGDSLLGVTRGINGTTDAAHSAGNVVQKISDAVTPTLFLYALRDLATPVAQSSGTQACGDKNCSVVPGLTGYDAYKFRYRTLFKVRDGSEAGKMRWIISDPGDGSFQYNEFLIGLGTCNVDLISAGFFTPIARAQENTYQSSYKLPCLWNYNGATIRDVWLYGSKDGLVVVVLDGSSYRLQYWGKYVPLGSPLKTATTSNVSSGAQTIPVANTDLFTEGGVYRILAQSVQDWIDNYDQSASTYMGASGAGEWPNLDSDETAYEWFIIDTIDPGAGTITTTQPLCYSYGSGAVIGEDIAPIASSLVGGSGSYYSPYEGKDIQARIAAMFHAAPKDVFLTTRPVHRIRWRCTADFDSKNPWEGDGAYDSYTQMEGSNPKLFPAANAMLDNEDYFGNRLPLIPYSLYFYYASNLTRYGAYNRIYGVLPFVRRMYASLGAASEDTIRVLWNGSYETFRVFYDADGDEWLAVGPEIAL